MKKKALVGLNNVICDRTGFKRKNTDMRYEWNGLLVLKEHWEPRQPQDFVTGVPDYQKPALSRPEQPDDGIGLLNGCPEVKPEDL